MKVLAYIASAVGLSATLWLAMIFIGGVMGVFPLIYVALMHPWVAPLISVAIVGIVAWRVERAA